jgi:hypothetical protein
MYVRISMLLSRYYDTIRLSLKKYRVSRRAGSPRSFRLRRFSGRGFLYRYSTSEDDDVPASQPLDSGVGRRADVSFLRPLQAKPTTLSRFCSKSSRHCLHRFFDRSPGVDSSHNENERLHIHHATEKGQARSSSFRESEQQSQDGNW